LRNAEVVGWRGGDLLTTLWTFCSLLQWGEFNLFVPREASFF
jgi:hypothetical protein